MTNKKIIAYTDGGSRNNPGIAGCGVYVTDQGGNELKRVAKPLGVKTNNWAEYEGVVTAFETIKKMYGKEATKKMQVEIITDSELVTKQLRGEYQIKDENLGKQFMKIWNLRVTQFPNVTFTHVLRKFNKEADALANEAMDQQI